MASEVEDKIPAFNMWKMFCETIPILFQIENCEANIVKLGTIIKSHDFSNIFQYSYEPKITREEREAIRSKYKSFIVWLLGQFFYMLSVEKSERVHDTIVDVQIRILHLVSVTQPNDYQEFAASYCEALKILTCYVKNRSNVNFNLKVFIPQEHYDLKGKLDLSPIFIEITSKTVCLNLLRMMLKIIRKILKDNIETYHLNQTIYDCLDDLLYITKECDLTMKLNVLNAVFTATHHIKSEKYPYILMEYFDNFAIHLEQLIYDISIGKFKLTARDRIIAENVLTTLSESLFYTNSFRKLRIYEVILNNYNNSLRFSDKLLTHCTTFVRNSTHVTENVDKILAKIFTNNQIQLLCFIEREIKMKGTSSDDLWNRVIEELKKNWQSRNYKSDFAVKTQLLLFDEVTNMAMRLNIHPSFPECLEEFARFCCNNLAHMNTEVVVVEWFLSGFANCGLFCTIPQLQIILQLILRSLKLPSTQGINFKNSYFKNFSLFILSRNVDKLECLNQFCKFLDMLLLRNWDDLYDLKDDFVSCLKEIGEHTLMEETARVLTQILKRSLILFKFPEELLTGLYQQLLMSENTEIIIQATSIISDIISMGSCNYFVQILWNEAEKNLTAQVFYDLREHDTNAIVMYGPFNTPFRDRALKQILVKQTCCFFNINNSNIKMNMIKALPFYMRYVEFHAPDLVKIWMGLISYDDKTVRNSFIDVLVDIVKVVQENQDLTEEHKEAFLLSLYRSLKIHTKYSMQHSHKELQEAILNALTNLSYIKFDTLILHIIDLLLFFLMIPTSKHCVKAAAIFARLEKTYKTKIRLVYLQFRKEFCKSIVQLAIINQTLTNGTFYESLRKVRGCLGFSSTKEFITQESEYLLRYLIPLLTTTPKVSVLINEIAGAAGMELPAYLSSVYSQVYMHIFLNEPEDVCKQAMAYLERETGITGGPTLQTNNFRVILNEILLNFHVNQERIVKLIQLLLERTDRRPPQTVQDYLESLLLGVLLNFDRKLDKQLERKNALLSLAQLFRFMGAKHLSKMRFKIIAMLRTLSRLKDNGFPHLTCKTWEAFVTCCDVGALGPQLATIFVSLVPFLDRFPHHVNGILRYLIVDNEHKITENIRDLFFVNDARIHPDILSVIKRHTNCLYLQPFKEQLNFFVKYLSQETIDIRLHGLRSIKSLLEENRKELDQIILGYNGIDPVVVNLLDALMSDSREKDRELKLMCGEVFGELGAIEPSHLPRVLHTMESFVFFIGEEGFGVKVLRELIRALQTDVTTQNLDRYSLAIQEILKVYSISPNEDSSGYHIWQQFTPIQQELMRPLLCSKYMNVQSTNFKFHPPIYGTSNGASLNSWLYNWIGSLISIIRSDRRKLLHACLPSMRETRIQIEFLPYILVQAILEGTPVDCGKIYAEMIAVVSSFNNNKLEEKILKKRPLLAPNKTPNKTRPGISLDENNQESYLKVIFILFDFLERWIREWIWSEDYIRGPNTEYNIINEFLQRFCKKQLAKCNFYCGEYPRALMYFEDYLIQHPNDMKESLSFLAELYSRLDEPDGVAGVMAIQQIEPTVEEKILALEVSGKLTDAVACYERAGPQLNLEHVKGLVRCYLNLDNVNTALNFVQGMIDNKPEHGSVLWELQAEPLWRLGRYDDLQELVNRPEINENNSWGVQVGKALLSLQTNQEVSFKSAIELLRYQQVEALGDACIEQGAYQQGYSYISKLHMLNEMQQTEKIIKEILKQDRDPTELVRQLTLDWELRLKVVQESVKVIEPILCLRRVLLNESKKIIKNHSPATVQLIDSLLGELWLASAKIARKSGLHQQAYTYTLKAEEYASPKVFLEKAKLHWLREEHEQALTILNRSLNIMLPEDTAKNSELELTLEQRKIFAEARLLIASYNDALSNVDTNTNIQYYKSAMDIYKEWEKSLVYLGQYYDKVFSSLPEEDRDTKGGTLQIHMVICFGKSLQYGSTYVYQSLPRLLSIWFDYGTRLLHVTNSSVQEERKAKLLQMTHLIDSCLERLPAYIFLTAFSQIISRICHPQREVYMELKDIIIKLLVQYPQQTLWMIISVMKSSYNVRAKRCAEIFADIKLKRSNPTLPKLIQDFTTLAEKLIELCNKQVNSDVTTTTVSALLRTLPRFLSRKDLSDIMVPAHKFRKLVLPNPDFHSSVHNPFPNNYVYIVGIEDEVTILASLQRPRKITLKGSDGKKYIVMLKPKDDLRKDFRLMEFNDIVNQLLLREADARQRRLNIRLYSVAPLNEECGLIEWVPNLVGLRPVVIEIYKKKGIYVRGQELLANWCSRGDALERKREVFLTKVLPKHPPVLGEWFKRTFPDAQTWLRARNAFTRTAAVMSMAGYILGLGDRHGENILLDSTSGDVVHVDFNCLFNKGETFEWPEMVPFRLTNNMVAAMGPLGVEGFFRRSCAVTLRVLRNNANTLMSIVTPFVYDPLVSWPANIVAGTSAQRAERTNEQAVEHVKNIHSRLKGIVKVRNGPPSLPLSVDGQVNHLIKEAMSVDNLCQMYIGWGPYL